MTHLCSTLRLRRRRSLKSFGIKVLLPLKLTIIHMETTSFVFVVNLSRARPVFETFSHQFIPAPKHSPRPAPSDGNFSLIA